MCLSKELAEYRQLEDKLKDIRLAHLGAESPEEDELLDTMDVAWARLSAEDRSFVILHVAVGLLQVGEDTSE